MFDLEGTWPYQLWTPAMIHPELWLWFTFSALCLWASVASRPESKFRIGGEGGETPPNWERRRESNFRMGEGGAQTQIPNAVASPRSDVFFCFLCLGSDT